MSVLLIKALLAYLLGSVIGSLVIGRMRGIDIRTMGSGNAGATNALRTQGKAIGLAVLVIDLAKGWVATALLAPMALPLLGSVPGPLQLWCAPVCGIAVMLGHVYPVWFGFRGGKGVATLLGTLLGISGTLVLVFVLVWLATVVLLGFVGLASILGAIAVALASLAGRGSGQVPLAYFTVLAAALIVYTHRANVARMRAGTEPRAMRLWLLGRRRSP
ncbi:MAG: glycerol-3-phosphate 1-O-acyltransferase PlsY [Proteobacteria bacterium]|nr:glycerol-3-phosphate 1-O-acyltransferase PlsY [Pseudomonadota bacterium]